MILFFSGSDQDGIGSPAVDGFDPTGEQHFRTAWPVQQSGGECEE